MVAPTDSHGVVYNVSKKMSSGVAGVNSNRNAGIEVKLSTGRSATATFSASSLSLGAVSCGTPSVVELSTPQFVAKSPALVKANLGAFHAAAVRVPALPCLFTLCGKRQTRGQLCDNDHSRSAKETSDVSPSRPSLRVIIRSKTGDAEGYSSRLRMMSGGGLKDKDKTAMPASAAMLDPPSLSSPRLASPPCAKAITACAYPEKITLGEGFLQDGSATGATGADVEAKTRAHPAPHAQDRPRSSQAHRLCGRLWTGTTAPLKFAYRADFDAGRAPVARPPRTLFLVSGQQQLLLTGTSRSRRLPGDMARLRRRIKSGRCRRSRPSVSMTSPPPTARNLKTAPPDGDATSRPGEWNWDDTTTSAKSESGREEGGGRDGLSLPESTTGPAADENYDVATAEAIAGEEDAHGRRVLHVRVPRPPPTSLLVLRSAPQTVLINTGSSS